MSDLCYLGKTRISQCQIQDFPGGGEGGTQAPKEEESQPIIWPFFPKNSCMKMKKFGGEGACVSPCIRLCKLHHSWQYSRWVLYFITELKFSYDSCFFIKKNFWQIMPECDLCENNQAFQRLLVTNLQRIHLPQYHVEFSYFRAIKKDDTINHWINYLSKF